MAIEGVGASAYVVPTDAYESDDTFGWDSTTLVLAEVEGGGRQGLGYTYADRAAAAVISGVLAPAVRGLDVLDVPAAWSAMQRSVRNLGHEGLCATAIAAGDTALWDLKARLLQIPLAALLGTAQQEVAIYGSGGFTSYSPERLQAQLAGWVDAGITRVR